MIAELDVHLAGGRVVHAYDTGPTGGDELAVMWHHGTPNIGSPPAPLFDAAARLGIRWIGFDRPGYGGSTAVAGPRRWPTRRRAPQSSPTSSASTGSP